MSRPITTALRAEPTGPDNVNGSLGMKVMSSAKKPAPVVKNDSDATGLPRIHHETRIGQLAGKHEIQLQSTAFEQIVNRFGRIGVNLVRRDWLRGPVRYYAFRAGQRPELCSLAHLGLILNLIGDHHA